jgi:cysteine synthase A
MDCRTRTSSPLCLITTSKMPDYSRYYIAGAFLGGIALTVAYNRTSGNSLESNNTQDASRQQHKVLSRLSKINDLDTLKKTLVELESSLVKGGGAGDIKEGIEGCIGDTPLIKIKSLSKYTGCEILVKAEFLNGAGNSPKDRVALSIIELVGFNCTPS